MTVDSASWRSPQRGGVARFGVITPAAAAAGPALLQEALSQEVLPGRPDAPAATWSVSTAPVGVLSRSYDGRPFSVRVHGTDAHARWPLQAVLTRLPAGGTLSVDTTTPVGESTSGVEGDSAALSVGDVVPVGTRLVYWPDAGAHDPWLGGEVGEYGGGSAVDWSAEGEPYDRFGYRVEAAKGGEVSENEAVVSLSVRPSLNAAHLDWPVKVGSIKKPFPTAEKRRDVGIAVPCICTTF